MKRELQHSESVCLMRFAIRDEIGENSMGVLSSGANHEFTDAVLGIGFPIWILLGKAFVIVVVAVDDDVRTRVIKNLPERLYLDVVAMRQTRAEQRPVVTVLFKKDYYY